MFPPKMYLDTLYKLSNGINPFNCMMLILQEGYNFQTFEDLFVATSESVIYIYLYLFIFGQK